MVISPYTLLFTTLWCSFAIFLLTLIMRLNSARMKKMLPFISLFIISIMIRFALPVEFIFTKSIGSLRLLPPVQKTLTYTVTGIDKNLQFILISIWIIGAVIKFTFFFVKYSKLYSVVNCLATDTQYDEILNEVMGNNRHNIRIVTMKDISSPVILGSFHPVIIMPEIKLSSKEVYYILRHEILHYKNKDIFIKIFCEILNIVYWWNPVIILLKKQLAVACEIKTDLTLTQNFTEEERIDYLDCLLKVAKNKTSNQNQLFTLAFTRENETPLKKRFDIILCSRPANLSKHLRILNFGLAILVLFFSYLIVVEPYFIDSEAASTTCEITPESSYFIKTDDATYDLYVEENYFDTFSTEVINLEFSDIPIYD